MSVTLTPTAGTVTVYRYYYFGADVAENMQPGDEVANGVVRVADEQPSLTLANGNWYMLMDMLGAPFPDDSCGAITPDEVDDLITRLWDAPVDDRYYAPLLEVLLHAKYHGCGLTYG